MHPDPRPIDATLSVARAAHVLGVHPNTVRAWSEQGRLRYYRMNARGDRRYRLGDLHAFLADAERGSAAMPTARVQQPADAATAQPAQGHSATWLTPAAGERAGSQPLLRQALHTKAPRPMRLAPAMSRAARGSAMALLDGRRPDAAPGGQHLAGAAPPTLAIRSLTDLAELAASRRSLDAVLHGAARLIRDATRASDVQIWEMRDDRLSHRAGSGTTGQASRKADRPTSAIAAIAGRAVSQRRPELEPLRGPGRGRLTAQAAEFNGPRLTSGVHADAMPYGVDIAVPIITDAPWGAITVRLRSLGRGDETVSWLEAAAAILATTIHTATLLDEAAGAVHRGEALRQVAMDTTGTLDLDETLARVVDHAMVLFGADRGGVFIRRPDGDVAAEVHRGLSASYLAAVRHFPVPSLPADAALARRPLFAMNYRDDVRCRAFRASVVQEGFDTICAAPLIDGDDILGVLNLYHDRPRAWSPVDLETMAVFASQVTVAVRSAQQYTQLARWAAQLQSIQQLGARLNRLTTIPEIASAIATELRVLVEYDNIRVYRLEGEDLNAVALHATDERYLDETPALVQSRLGEGITGWVAAHGIAQNLPDTSNDPRTQDIPGSEAFDESMLLAPLIFEDRVLGVVALARHGLRQFADDDLRLLEIYAIIAAQAMANADTTERLRGQSEALQRQLRSQRELLDITESILSTLDSRAVLGQIADRLGRLVRYDSLAIEVYDRRTGALVPLTAKGHDDHPRPHLAPDNGLAGWVIRHNQPRLEPGGPTDGAGRPGVAPAAWSRIVVPLRGREGVTGVLTLARAAASASFTGDEFELVQLFAAQVSIALQNAETHRAVEVRARTDDLTGLLNHGSLREWLAQGALGGGTFSLIMLDLDEFKAVNDAFGHQAGDRLLSGIGTAIVAAGRDSDLVFRYGGDEFAIVLPGTDVLGALQVAERIQSAVHRVGRPGGRRADPVEITASIGIATFPQDGATGADILLAADRACFVAKRGGRNRIADAAKGLSLAAEFSLQEPTPVDWFDPHWDAESVTTPVVPEDQELDPPAA